MEVKQTPQEQSRPKSSGKANRREYPAFDISPTVAFEYLRRIQKGTEGIPVSKDRPFYVDEESHLAVQFQKPLEVYTPWKDLPFVEEKQKKKESAENHPATWADLAKKKLDILGEAKGNVSEPKGVFHGVLSPLFCSRTIPGVAKPKLISKTSSQESSPWKVQRNAPKLSPSEVPNVFRPLLGFALWRIHESVDRNDSNQLFVLTDDAKLRDTASRLNITVLSSSMLKSQVDSQTKSNVASFGDVEREGLSKAKVNGTAEPAINGLKGSEGSVSKAIQHRELLAEQEAETAPEVQQPTLLEPEKCTSSEPISMAKIVELPVASEKMTQNDDADQRAAEKPLPAAIDPKELVQSLLKPGYGNWAALLKGKESSLPSMAKSSQASSVLDGHATSSQEPKSVRSDESLAPVTESLLEPSSQAIVENAAEESDEDVVVFVPNPKRMSAQKHSSRPSTANGHARHASGSTPQVHSEPVTQTQADSKAT